MFSVPQAALKAAFDKVDTDKDGKVSHADLKAVLQEAGFDGNDSNIKVRTGSNQVRPRRNARLCADDMHFLEWNGYISIQISLKSVPKSPINNTPALV